MNTVLQFVQDNWKQIVEAADAIVANGYAGYAFICNHGGVRTMWSKFLGPKQPDNLPSQPQSNQTPKNP